LAADCLNKIFQQFTEFLMDNLFIHPGRVLVPRGANASIRTADLLKESVLSGHGFN
tara:strand:+ start:5520 stop:5687 length:168 start_codon:yes stop_codon:yes gene_type:complete